jgi:DNA-binding SARP family transcriptional activator
LFWPDFPEEGARANLRQALANLRQVLEEEQNESPFLIVDRETLHLNPECDCLLDVAEFERLTAPNASARDLEAAIPLYRGDFLEIFTLRDNPDFNDWTALLRERYLQLASKALRKLGALAARTRRMKKPLALTIAGWYWSPGRKMPISSSCPSWRLTGSAPPPWHITRLLKRF